MSNLQHAFYGSCIHSSSPEAIEILADTLLLVDNDGCITSVSSNISRVEAQQIMAKHGLPTDFPVVNLQKHEFLIPGFVDTHNHAPQYAQRGLGQGLHILDWLNQLTFPNEAKFADTNYARDIYSRCVSGFIKQGITCVSYYGSLHGPATQILAEQCLEKGQRAFIGKCNMNQNSPEFYIEKSAEESIAVTKKFIDHVRNLDKDGKLIRPIITPRFAISCDAELLTGLGNIVKDDPSLAIQTHFNEAKQEIDATLQLFPTFTNEADLYHHFGLLTEKSILAHCTIMTEYDLQRLGELQCGVAHCPIANTTVGGGFMAAPVREFLRRGIKVGLGTDSGGGFSASILDAMRVSLIVSNAREVMDGSKALTIPEVFHLGTLGGAKVCGLDHIIGTFAVGKQFDALMIRAATTTAKSLEEDSAMTMVEDGDTLATVFDKFVMTGDDRNIAQVYINGRKVKG